MVIMIDSSSDTCLIYLMINEVNIQVNTSVQISYNIPLVDGTLVFLVITKRFITLAVIMNHHDNEVNTQIIHTCKFPVTIQSFMVQAISFSRLS